MLQTIPGVIEVCRVSGTSNLRLSEEQQLRFVGLKVMVDRIEIRVQTSDIREVHFEWEGVQPLFNRIPFSFFRHVIYMEERESEKTGGCQLVEATLS